MKTKDRYLTRRRGGRGVKTMKTVYIPCHSVCSVVNGRLSAQRDSGNSILGMGLMGPIGLMGQKPMIKNGPAQRDSKMSKLPEVRSQKSGVRMKTKNRKTRMRPAQRRSKMSNLVWVDIVTPKSVIEVIFTMQVKNKILFYPLCLCVFVVNTLPQRYSRMSNLKIETENSLPQRYSKMSILDFGGIASAERSKQAMFIWRIKNMAGCFMGGRLSVLLCWPHGRETIKLKIESGKLKMESMGRKHKSESSSAQRDSGMSNLEERTERTSQTNLQPLNGTLKCPTDGCPGCPAAGRGDGYLKTVSLNGTLK